MQIECYKTKYMLFKYISDNIVTACFHSELNVIN